ncbi:MAG: M15 family metallopeptidase [Lachnospiraceae bacterium]
MGNRKKMSRQRRKNRRIFRNIILTLILILGLVLVWRYAIPAAQKGMELLGKLNTVGTQQSSVIETSKTAESSKDTLQAESIEDETEDLHTVSSVDASETGSSSGTEKASETASETAETNVTTQGIDASSGDDWMLILVNKDHPIPDNYKISFTELSNGQKVDTRIYPDLQAMFDAARASGLQLFVREGYRTQEEQQQIMDDRIRKYVSEGNTQEEAKKLAEEYVAVPGTSEHQLGLSVDINPENSSQESKDKVYSWLAANAYTYGFIKRYPSDKVDITGISNEPWHYRYVGKTAAAEMQEKGLCLEEYLEQK